MGVDSVLQSLSSRIGYCLEKAARAGKRAADSRDPIERRDSNVIEENSNLLARSQDFQERLERFLVYRQTAGRMIRQSTEAASKRDNREQGAVIPGKLLISIVDDHTGVRESLRRLVVSLGHASGAFVTAEEYLESELLGETACLICDVQLPGMSGPDLQARLIADGHRIPIVFVTGSFNETTRARVLTAGAIGYLAKPFDA